LNSTEKNTGRYRNIKKEWGNKLIAESELNGNEVILDLGCGNSVLSKQLAALVPKG
jgi:ubiquinone/menaquinone biosynthesis C-methylase UbiE